MEIKRKKAELISLKAQLERIGEEDTYTRAPVGRPIKRTSDTPDTSDAVNRPKRSRRGERIAPESVVKYFKNLKSKGNALHKTRLPCPRSTFHVCPNLAKPYKRNATSTFKLHILDPQALGAPDTPCPVHGFCGEVTSNGWIKTPRVAHGVSASEYFVGRR